MSLVELVRPLVDSHTDAEIAAILNAPTVAKTDSQKYTWAGLMLRFGAPVCMQLAGVLEAIPGSAPILSSLINPGIDFSLDMTQAMLDQFVGALGAENVSNLKAVGRWSVSPWNDAGFEGEVTVEQVAEARADIESVRFRQQTAAVSARVWNEIVNPAVAQGQSWAEIVAAIVEDAA